MLMSFTLNASSPGFKKTTAAQSAGQILLNNAMLNNLPLMKCDLPCLSLFTQLHEYQRA